MVHSYLIIILLFHFLKASQLEISWQIMRTHPIKVKVWLLSVDNIPYLEKDINVQAPPPIQRSSKNHETDDNERTDSDSSEDSAELGGVNYYRYTKRNKTRGAKRHHAKYNCWMDKIVGGVEVDINLYPYHVAYGCNCGGALIASKWVMTAGHCGKKPYIKVGSKYINSGQKVMVKQHYIHPNWLEKLKDHPFDYDYQLLELSEHLKFSDNVQPIKLGHPKNMVIGSVLTVTGWGHTYEHGEYSSILRAVRVPIIAKLNCQSVPFPYFRGSLTSRMFCAGYPQGMKDACQGDSGGPAVAGDRLLGIISFGYGCATPGAYGVYSKVSEVRDWIEKTTGIFYD